MRIGDSFLRVDRVSKRLKRRQVLSEVSFHVGKGEVVLIRGPNGSGKTTLLRTIAGVLRPDSGRVLLLRRNVHEDLDVRAKISYCPERLGLLRDYTILDNMKFFVGVFGRPYDGERLRRYLRMFQLEEYLKDEISKLSAGTRKKVALVRSMSFPAEIYLLDEPLANLDRESAHNLVKEVRKLADEGVSFLIASHIEFPGADRELEMKGGRIVEV